MKRKTYPRLIKAAGKITQAEMCFAPELSTLVALDATLLATINMFEFNYPCPGRPASAKRNSADGAEEHIVDSIFIMAKALRSNLSAYYATVQENCGYNTANQEIMF